MAITPMPSFRDLLHQAQQFDIFTKATETVPPTHATFMAANRSSSDHSSKNPLSASNSQQQRHHGNLNRGSQFSQRSGRGSSKSAESNSTHIKLSIRWACEQSPAHE
ncbi:hypothetical protein ACS0TY_029267 [Phlomoides rotata]